MSWGSVISLPEEAPPRIHGSHALPLHHESRAALGHRDGPTWPYKRPKTPRANLPEPRPKFPYLQELGEPETPAVETTRPDRPERRVVGARRRVDSDLPRCASFDMRAAEVSFIGQPMENPPNIWETTPKCLPNVWGF